MTKNFNIFGVITNIFWFYWCLYNIRLKEIDFDFVCYAKVKFLMIKYFVNKIEHN